MSGLALIGQDDFGVGILRGTAPDVQPGVGTWTVVNGVVNDDGDVYRRGGTHYASNASAAQTFLWSGYLADKATTLLATATRFYSVDSAGVLTDLGGPGLAGPVSPAVVNDHIYLPSGFVWGGPGTTPSTANWSTLNPILRGLRPTHLTTAANRLIVGQGNIIAFSNPGLPGTFTADDYHELPEGTIVQGLAAIRDTVLVFSNYGLWSITNMALDLTDAAGNLQQSLALLNAEISLWHESGLCEWAGSVVAPCIDRIYRIDLISPPAVVSDSIVPLYMSYLRAGYRPGGAKVFRNSLFLPILSGSTVVALLVCRLNRPTRGRLLYYPFATITGFGQGMVMADVNLLGAAPRFQAAHSSGRIVDYTDLFVSDGTVSAVDADGSTYEFDLETRDFPTGNGQPNHVRELRLRYTLEGQATIKAGVSYGQTSQTYQQLVDSGQRYADVKAAYATYASLLHGGGAVPWVTDQDPARSWLLLSPSALPSPGLDPIRWRLPQAQRVRFVRARFRCSDAPSRLIVHGLWFGVRSAAHSR